MLRTIPIKHQSLLVVNHWHPDTQIGTGKVWKQPIPLLSLILNKLGRRYTGTRLPKELGLITKLEFQLLIVVVKWLGMLWQIKHSKSNDHIYRFFLLPKIGNVFTKYSVRPNVTNLPESGKYTFNSGQKNIPSITIKQTVKLVTMKWVWLPRLENLNRINWRVVSCSDSRSVVFIK